MTPLLVFAKADGIGLKQSHDILQAMSERYYVYIMTNPSTTVLYVGVTGNLTKIVYEHKSGFVDGFTRKYNAVKLVYYEVCEDVQGAIQREKQIKAGSRQKKMELIDTMNRKWRDLYDEL